MASKQWLKIRKLAYSIWEQEGYPDGKDIDHWLQAEREIKLLALYRDFQKIRRSLNHLYPTIRYDDAFFSQKRYNGTAILVVTMAQGHILTATHIINRFSNELRSVTAWNKVFEAVAEAERIAALYEFIYPIASQCLSMPYSIKQMFIKSICQLSHQTNRFYDSNGMKERFRKNQIFLMPSGWPDVFSHGRCCVLPLPCSMMRRLRRRQTTIGMKRITVFLAASK
jgi:hypothetical protein